VTTAKRAATGRGRHHRRRTAARARRVRDRCAGHRRDHAVGHHSGDLSAPWLAGGPILVAIAATVTLLVGLFFAVTAIIGIFWAVPAAAVLVMLFTGAAAAWFAGRRAGVR
jgi:hypothetical protein